MTDKQASKTREKILDAATRLFLSKPYSKVSIDDIASLSGYSKGAVFHYFKSKIDIARAVLSLLIERLVAIPLRQIIQSNMTFKEKIFKIVDLSLGFSLGHDFKSLLFLGELYYELKTRNQERFIKKTYRVLLNTMYSFLKENNIKNPAVKTIIFMSILDGLSIEYMLYPELFKKKDFVSKLKEEIYNFLKG